MGAIMVAAYSYMALVPIIQPIAIKACTTKRERRIHMNYNPRAVSKTSKVLFPVIICIIAVVCIATGLAAACWLPHVR